MTRSKNMDPRQMSGRERHDFGVIVSFEADDGRRLTLHQEGAVKASIREACARALAVDETYRVVAVSTPSSIMGDLNTRETRELGRYEVAISNVDAQLLGQARCSEMLHQRYRLLSVLT